MAWGDQATIANNHAINMSRLTKMLTMTRTKDDPEFSGAYSSAKALERIAAALERLAGAHPLPCDFSAAEAFVFAAGAATLVPVPRVNRVDIGLLRGIDQARDILLGNTLRFAQNFAANNALLWGARGMGKSALIKAVHATINARLAASPNSKPLKLVEIHREDIEGLPRLLRSISVLAWTARLWRREALEWALTRGSRSGRTAWQYIQDLAGRLGKAAEPHFVSAPPERCKSTP